MPIANWLTDPSWDFLVLNDKRLPGVAVVDLKCEDDQDQQKAQGSKAARTVDKGDKPVKFKVTLTMATPAEAQGLTEFMPILRPKAKGATRDPVTAIHPQCDIWGIGSVTIGALDAPSPKAGAAYIVSFTMTEWVPAPKKLDKAKTTPAKGEDPAKLAAKLRADAKKAAQDNFK